MEILILQHASFAGPGRLLEALEEENFSYHVHKTYEKDLFPSAIKYAGVILLGGPQEAFSESNFSSRKDELSLIKYSLQTEMPFLGICLGAQLLAIAGGGAGYKSTTPEIGWHEIELTQKGKNDPLFKNMPEKFFSMQSHFDSVVLGKRTELLARSASFSQAWKVGERAWGLQFHLEADADFITSRRQNVIGWQEAENGTPKTPLLQKRSEEALSTLIKNFAEIIKN